MALACLEGSDTLAVNLSFGFQWPVCAAPFACDPEPLITQTEDPRMAGLSVGTYRISRMRAVKDARIYEPDDYKSRVKQMWSKRAPQYDFKNDFHPPLCEQLVSLADIKGQAARVLDVATGTGTVAVSAACALGPSGTVTAIDVSQEMLTQAGPLYRFARGSNMLCTAQVPTEPANETCIHASNLPHSGLMGWQLP